MASTRIAADLDLIPFSLRDPEGIEIPIINGMIQRIWALAFDSIGEAPGKNFEIIEGRIERWVLDMILVAIQNDPLTSFLIGNITTYAGSNATGSAIFGPITIAVSLNPEPAPDSIGSTGGKNAQRSAGQPIGGQTHIARGANGVATRRGIAGDINS